MTVLVVSPDEEAARSLCAALHRTGRTARWEHDPDVARRVARSEPPLVLVVDASIVEHGKFLSEVHDAAPWTRAYLMADPAEQSETGAHVLLKPFDAAEVAGLLAREHELADLDRLLRGLEARAQELALLVEVSFEAIVGLAPDGTVRSWNPGAAAIYGYAPEEMVGRSIDALAAEPGAATPRRTSGQRGAVEVKRRRKDGSEVIVLLSLSPITGQSGAALGFAEVSLDITARRKLERALEHGERLAALGRLAASMAHEINNPLAVIRATVTRIAGIATETGGTTELAECASDLDLASDRIASFVQHVCGFARRERPILSDALLSSTIDMSIRLARPRVHDKRLVLEPAPDLRVLHDPPRLAQAIVNIVVNGLQAATSSVRIRVVDEGSQVRIEVDDDGPGIAPEIADRLFEPFATTKPPGEGTGLGLSITRQILEDHGGSASIGPLEGGGTRALLVLPSQDIRRFVVLVVDRDPAVRRALATDVGRAGFGVRSAGTFEQAREMLAGEDVRVVLTELWLPDGRAHDFLATVRDESPLVGRIVVTTDRRAATDVPAEHVFEKPWDRDPLIAAVREMCLRRA